VRSLWAKESIYLHVDKSNMAAAALYKSMNYKEDNHPQSAMWRRVFRDHGSIEYRSKRLVPRSEHTKLNDA
jgi:ribosomal protein S18 acetylase RimI-like enzyme